jgi:hypothetical protein
MDCTFKLQHQANCKSQLQATCAAWSCGLHYIWFLVFKVNQAFKGA